MPTGYTSEIKEGVSFKDFALACARAFGACVTLRDDPSGKPIPKEFKPTTYHKEKIGKATKEFALIEKMVLKEADKEAEKEYKKELSEMRKYINEGNKQRRLYENMLSQVRAWQPPTTDHKGLKKFMIEQIGGSIDFDCNNEYWVEKLDKIKLLTGQQWVDKEKKRLIKDISYHTKGDIEEISRVNSRNNWLKKLRDSLA